MKTTSQHEQRIRQELIKVGVTKVGLRKFTIKHLPKIIHKDEHIGGVVYGRYTINEKTSWWNQGMLVATDRRVIFLDHKPGYTSMDELTYDVVAGLKYSTTAYAMVTLQTRLGNYTIRFANNKCVETFIEYVESQRLEKIVNGQEHTKTTETGTSNPKPTKEFNQKELAFLKDQETAVISTIDRNGNVHGAVVYYTIDDSNLIYILTKSETDKVHNILVNEQVALTIFETKTAKTLQIQGVAELEPDQKIKENVFNEIAKTRNYDNEKDLPPVTKLTEGSFIVIRITPTLVKYTDYKQLKR